MADRTAHHGGVPIDPRDNIPSGADLAGKAARWDRIRDAWELYRREGSGAFDWDYDSRDLMRELTAEGSDEDQGTVIRVLGSNEED